MATQNVCKFNKFGYCRYKDACRNLHRNEICQNSSCEIKGCNLRHPRECRYYREYRRCKFDPCKFKHIANLSYESEIDTLRRDHLKSVKRLEEIEKLLNEKNDVETNIKIINDKLEGFEKQIQKMEQSIREKEHEINEFLSKHNTEEKNILRKRNILQRLEEVEKINNEKDIAINLLMEKVQKLEENLKSIQDCEKQGTEVGLLKET